MTIVQFLTRADEVFVPVLTEFGNGITMGMLLLGILLVPVALYAVVDLFRK
jgi:tetrahydromethanopterin S-methyltransferase subunit F